MQNIENLIETERYIEAKNIMSKEIQDVIEGNEYSTIEVQYNAYPGMSDEDEPNTKSNCYLHLLESAIDNDDFEEEDEATIQKLKDVVELCKKHDISYIVMSEYDVDNNN